MKSLLSLTKQLSQEQVRRYADASGDHNPIHVDEAFARATPFGGTIAHGMLTLAAISEMMAAEFGEVWITRGRLRVRFRGPVSTAATITATATRQADKDGMFVYAVDLRGRDGEQLISGTAEVPAGG